MKILFSFLFPNFSEVERNLREINDGIRILDGYRVLKYKLDRIEGLSKLDKTRTLIAYFQGHGRIPFF